MNIRNHLLVAVTAFSTLLPLTGIAQVQRGQVRTIERPNKKSQGLGGVIITVHEAPNSILSDAAGTFSFNLPGKKEGDAYTIRNVQKKDYTLIDKAVRGRKYGFSSKAPLEIVMVSRQQLEEDKQHIEEQAMEQAEKQYQQQCKELDRLREEKRLSDEEYANKQKKLGDDYEKFMRLAEQMAEVYALTDFKNISEINRQIHQAIENAELEKADSLIRSKGNYDEREKEAKLLLEMGQHEKAMGEKHIHEGTEKRNDLAQDYYNQHTICASKLDFSSAADYLERRAALDPTNALWLLDAANFISEKLSNFEKAEHLAQQALQIAIEHDGADSETTAYCMNDLANIQTLAGHFDKAMKSFCQSAEIRRHVFGEQSKELALSYSNMGTLFKHMDALDSAQVYYEKALHIHQLLSDDCSGITECYVNLGKMEKIRGNHKGALEYYHKALPLLVNCEGETCYSMVELCNAFGSAYLDADSLDTSLSWYERALDITIKLYGKEHLDVSTCLANIGFFYSRINHHKEAYEYDLQAHELRIKALGENHPKIAASYNNLAADLYRLKKREEALSYMQKALELDKLFYSENSSAVANDYANIAVSLADAEQFDKALELNEKALQITTDIYGEQSKEAARIYANIADIYLSKKDLTKAIDYSLKSINILEATYGDKHSSLISAYNNLSGIYEAMGDYQKQTETLQDALQLSVKIYGEDNDATARQYSNLALACYNIKDCEKAISYSKKAKDIKDKIYGKGSLMAEMENALLGKFYEATGEHTLAIEAYSGLVSAFRSEYGDESKAVISYIVSIYNNFHSLLEKHPTPQNHKWFQQFMEDKCVVVVPAEGYAAAQKGLNEECPILHYFDWTIEDTTASIFSVAEKVKPLPKSIVVYKDGQPQAFDFEETTIGVLILIKFVDPAKKAAIVKAWKEQK